jgi:type II secretory pathway pseudopilin PulG
MRMPRAATLVEIIVVVAIVGVLAGLSTVAVSDIVGRARLLADAQELDDLLRRGRLLARMERRCVLVVTSQRRLDVVPLEHGGAPPADCSAGRPVSDRNLGKAFPRGISIAPTTFFFDRAGGAVVPGGSSRVGDGVDIAVTVTPPGAPIKVFIVRVLAGTGAITRIG